MGDVAAPKLTEGPSAGATPAKVKRLSPAQQQVYDVVLGAQLAGADGMTNREIGRALEFRHNRRFGEGAVASRVTELVNGGYLDSLTEKRRCLVTGELAFARFVPAKQGRLVP